MDDLQTTAGEAPAWWSVLPTITGQFFSSRKAGEPALRWLPGPTPGSEYAVGADGKVYTRGQAATALAPATSRLLAQVVPIVLLVGGALIALRFVRR